MFTGIVECTGSLRSRGQVSQNMDLVIEPGKEGFLKQVRPGASMAVNGVCLTVTGTKPGSFRAFVSTETYRSTNLKDARVRDLLNLEKSLRLNDRLDGHMVSGHIDGTGLVTEIYRINRDYRLNVRIKADLLKYTVAKGSIAVNGISLTIMRKYSDILAFSIIPETYGNTNIPQLKSGEKVNLEVDMMAKYIWQFCKRK